LEGQVQAYKDLVQARDQAEIDDKVLAKDWDQDQTHTAYKVLVVLVYKVLMQNY